MSIFVAVFILSVVLQYLSIKFAHSSKLFIDCHKSCKPQRFHSEPTPRIGGVGIFLASLPIVFLSTLSIYLIAAASIAFASGILEDFSNKLSAHKRLIMHILASLLFVVLLGFKITTVGFGITFPTWFAVLFTIFAIVGVINAINIIDGFNGLASGFALIVFAIYAVISYMLQDTELMMICLVMLCALFGFFVWNFPYGKIFLGDGGAYFLGFMIGAISVMIISRHPHVSAWFCLLVCIYPVWEVLFSFYRKKLVRNISPFEPDKSHLHMLIHKRITKSNPKTSLFILATFAPYQIIALFVMQNELLLILFVAMFIFHYGLTYNMLAKFRRKRLSVNQCVADAKKEISET